MNDNSEKARLLQQSEEHEQEMDRSLRSIVDSPDHIVKHALLVGCVLAGAYLLVPEKRGKRKKQKTVAAKNRQPGKPSHEAPTKQPGYLQGLLSDELVNQIAYTIGKWVVNALRKKLVGKDVPKSPKD